MRRAQVWEWWGVAVVLFVAALLFAVVRGPALVVPAVLLAGVAVQATRLRSRGVDVVDGTIRISRWRSTVEVPADRARLRFVNLGDWGPTMSPVLEEVDGDGRVVRSVTLSEIRFVDEPAWSSDQQFRTTNAAALELYDRVARAVAHAEEPHRWLSDRRGT